MRHEKVEEKYRIFLWDNGGARAICAAYGLIAYGLRISGADAPKNVGKAIAMQYLVDIVKEALPDATCYVCMDDDVIVDRVHLDALAEAALRPSLGMIAARFHPFNSVVPPGGTVIEVDPCRACSGAEGSANCAYCRGSGKDPHGLRLRTYPGEDRTEKNLGKIAGTLFAVSKATIAKSQWAPHLYPILLRRTDNQPVLYWGEDANLDIELTKLGLINGYLEMPGLSPAIHLPELDPDYMSWKVKARQHPQIDEFKSEAPLAE